MKQNESASGTRRRIFHEVPLCDGQRLGYCQRKTKMGTTVCVPCELRLISFLLLPTRIWGKKHEQQENRNSLVQTALLTGRRSSRVEELPLKVRYVSGTKLLLHGMFGTQATYLYAGMPVTRLPMMRVRMLRLPLPKLRQGPSLPTPVTQCKRRAQVLRWGQSVTLDGEWLGRFRCPVRGGWGWSASPSGRRGRCGAV